MLPDMCIKHCELITIGSWNTLAASALRYVTVSIVRKSQVKNSLGKGVDGW